MPKILLVDDDIDLSMLTRFALVKKGFEVTVCHDAKKAIEEAIKHTPDLILMDIMLPGLSGGDAVRKLKLHPSLIKTPVIFLTGLISTNEKEVESEGVMIDGVKYKSLGKPYEIDKLATLVKKTIEEMVKN